MTILIPEKTSTSTARLAAEAAFTRRPAANVQQGPEIIVKRRRVLEDVADAPHGDQVPDERLGGQQEADTADAAGLGQHRQGELDNATDDEVRHPRVFRLATPVHPVMDPRPDVVEAPGPGDLPAVATRKPRKRPAPVSIIAPPTPRSASTQKPRIAALHPRVQLEQLASLEAALRLGARLTDEWCDTEGDTPYPSMLEQVRDLRRDIKDATEHLAKELQWARAAIVAFGITAEDLRGD